jgi:low density lipoprotein-related protein 2
MDNEQKESVAVDSPPSPLPTKTSPKRDLTVGYTATEDTFKDTANLVKEDSEA